MKRFLTSMLLLAVSLPASAGVPSFVTYSGRLTDGTGWGESTAIDLTLRLYGQEQEGDALWEQEFPCPTGTEPTCVAVQDGYFSVMLGDGENAQGQGLNVITVFAANEETWITACVGQGCMAVDEMTPRQQIGSVPYAATSAVSGSVGGADYDEINRRMALTTARAMCMTMSCTPDCLYGTVYPFLDMESSGDATCAHYNRTCFATVYSPLLSFSSGTSWSLKSFCDTPADTPGWFACCSY